MKSDTRRVTEVVVGEGLNYGGLGMGREGSVRALSWRRPARARALSGTDGDATPRRRHGDWSCHAAWCGRGGELEAPASGRLRNRPPPIAAGPPC